VRPGAPDKGPAQLRRALTAPLLEECLPIPGIAPAVFACPDSHGACERGCGHGFRLAPTIQPGRDPWAQFT